MRPLKMAVASVAVLLASLALSDIQLGAAATRSPHCGGPFPAVIDDGFPQAPMRFSQHGRLDTRLRMQLGTATIAGEQYAGAMTYEGTFPGPTLVVCPGDHVKVRLENRLAKGQVTNLHVHGLHVSPRARHDNVYRHLSSGRSQTYTYDLPADHEPGAYWYHPHHHMFVAPQIFAGLSGAIVVRGGLDEILRDVPQRLMMIQSTELCARNGQSVAFPTSSPGGSGTEPCKHPSTVIPAKDTNERFTPLLVNGAIDPTVKIRPGQIQRWRIFNANDNRIVVLNLAGQDLQVLAEDGNTLRWMRPHKNLQIAPGSRREVLVRGGSPGAYKMTALPFEQFPTGDHAIQDITNKGGGPTPGQTVLTVVSAGVPAQDELPRGPFASQPDLRARHVDRRRTICFNEHPLPKRHAAHGAIAAMDMPAMTVRADGGSCKTPSEDKSGRATEFLINNKAFDPSHIAVTMKLDAVEEWTLVNANTEWHTFHIHVNPFQVIRVEGKRVPYVDYEDNVALPPRSKVVIRMNPTDFTGKFVIHCHVANHEDRGMMAAVRIVR
ncbi:MAG: hypothetical protein QOI73_3622 [Solirubrobacteraceae bacterium]|nr:hypothetical protein [Solirubrobacteraceae bacterium]